jgi:hypothetical protein
LEINFNNAALEKLSVSQIVAICETCGCELAATERIFAVTTGLH